MKIAVAVHDPKGFNFTSPGEPLRFTQLVCHKKDCGCDVSLTGIHSLKGATLAIVTEGDVPVVSMAEGQRAGATALVYWDALRRAIESLAVGTMFRVFYLWRRGEPGGNSDPARWRVTIARPLA
jgi:hypothetical protein